MPATSHLEPSPSPPPLLPTAEEKPTVDLYPTAGTALGYGRSATYSAAARGEIPGLIRIGGKYRVATAELRRFLGLDRS